jgi:mannose-6-phosphate isomerase-like protein (cupin superfamily)
MAAYTVARISETEGAYGGNVRRLRAALGVTSFGLSVQQFPPNSGDLYPVHDESRTGQEEVYLPLAGSGEIVVDDETVAIDQDTAVRVPPGTPRQLRSGPDGMVVLALGGPLLKPYEIQAWTELGGPDRPDVLP